MVGDNKRQEAQGEKKEERESLRKKERRVRKLQKALGNQNKQVTESRCWYY